ncbi:hypothetical protein OROMI_014735 [Orobanche minor]
MDDKQTFPNLCPATMTVWYRVMENISVFNNLVKEIAFLEKPRGGAEAIMDELTRGIQNDVPWCMMFADDIVLIDEMKVGVQQKLELWRDTLEARGFRLSRSKTEYMECRFSDNSDREAERITFDGKVVHGSTFFRYLGSIIQKDGELDGDVAHRIKAGWLKWKSATGVLCDPDMPHRLKGKFYRTAIRPALLYGTECWAVKQCHVQKMNVAEMRMLRWMCGHTKKDRLRNEVIREKVRVASIEDKMMENRLRWFGHVRRRPVDAPVRRLESWGTSNIVKGRGRPKKTWIKLIKNDMRFLGIRESMAMERCVSVHAMAVKYDGKFIDSFLKVNAQFQMHKDLVLHLIKELQKATRTIQALCSEAKVSSLTPHPIMGLHLHLPVYVQLRTPLNFCFIEGLKTNCYNWKNSCHRDLWNDFCFMSRNFFTQRQVDARSGWGAGNLKHKDLMGQIVSSQAYLDDDKANHGPAEAIVEEPMDVSTP